MLNFIKRIPPFSSYWIKQCVIKEFKKIAKPEVYLEEIYTFVADRMFQGWKVYCKINYPIDWDEFIRMGWTNGYVIIYDNGIVDFSGIIQCEKIFYSKSIVDEAKDIIAGN